MVDATAALIEKDLAAMVEGDDALETSYDGLAKPALDAPGSLRRTF